MVILTEFHGTLFRASFIHRQYVNEIPDALDSIVEKMCIILVPIPCSITSFFFIARAPFFI